MNAVEWKAKTTVGSNYDNMKEPSTFDIETEDLDKDTYRSVATGNMIANIISKNWSSLQFKYDNLTAAEVKSLADVLKAYPIYVKIKHPFYTSEVEMEMRCSRKKLSKLYSHSEIYSMEFNLIQTKVASGQ